jgi:hypothetical protein
MFARRAILLAIAALQCVRGFVGHHGQLMAPRRLQVSFPSKRLCRPLLIAALALPL